MPGLRFRAATADDWRITADLVFGTDDQVGARVAVALFGARDHEQLRTLMSTVWRKSESWRSTWLALDDNDEIVGLVMLGEPRLTLDAGLVGVAVRTLGWRALRLPLRLRLAARVSPDKPAGSLVVGELHVRPDLRGHGIGAELLEHATALAMASGHHALSLDTYTTNPACRLYERAGFVAAASTHETAFERLTGVAGRVLYVKPLMSA